MNVSTVPIPYEPKRDVRAYGGLVRGINVGSVAVGGSAVLPKFLGRLGLGVSSGFALIDTVQAARATGFSAHTRETAARGVGGVAGAFYGGKLGALGGASLGRLLPSVLGVRGGGVIGGVLGAVLGGSVASDLVGWAEHGIEHLFGTE